MAPTKANEHNQSRRGGERLPPNALPACGTADASINPSWLISGPRRGCASSAQAKRAAWISLCVTVRSPEPAEPASPDASRLLD
jgi:hypothetical protein